MPPRSKSSGAAERSAEGCLVYAMSLTFQVGGKERVYRWEQSFEDHRPWNTERALSPHGHRNRQEAVEILTEQSYEMRRSMVRGSNFMFFGKLFTFNGNFQFLWRAATNRFSSYAGLHAECSLILI